MREPKNQVPCQSNIACNVYQELQNLLFCREISYVTIYRILSILFLPKTHVCWNQKQVYNATLENNNLLQKFANSALFYILLNDFFQGFVWFSANVALMSFIKKIKLLSITSLPKFWSPLQSKTILTFAFIASTFSPCLFLSNISHIFTSLKSLKFYFRKYLFYLGFEQQEGSFGSQSHIYLSPNLLGKPFVDSSMMRRKIYDAYMKLGNIFWEAW